MRESGTEAFREEVTIYLKLQGRVFHVGKRKRVFKGEKCLQRHTGVTVYGVFRKVQGSLKGGCMRRPN